MALKIFKSLWGIPQVTEDVFATYGRGMQTAVCPEYGPPHYQHTVPFYREAFS
ncbi:MAG: hypothetical protein ABI863_20040 [Ginsengibacter sp.]